MFDVLFLKQIEMIYHFLGLLKVYSIYVMQSHKSLSPSLTDYITYTLFEEFENSFYRVNEAQFIKFPETVERF